VVQFYGNHTTDNGQYEAEVMAKMNVPYAPTVDKIL
jgi:hypothetical protein